MTTLSFGKQLVQIANGELTSYSVDGHEFIHQKGSPGWGSSDTEMFPIIGPVDQTDFRVATPRGYALQDQHGLLRQFPYERISNNAVTATYQKKYLAGTPIKNSKFPVKSPQELLQWPYDFVFTKLFTLSADGLEIQFTISGDIGMPFMLGYHPAFKLNTSQPILKTTDRHISLEEVLAVGSRALEVPNCNTLTLQDEKSITIRTKGFKHFMCWTEVPNMVCIEPITFYPYALEQQRLHEGFEPLKDEKTFGVLLSSKS